MDPDAAKKLFLEHAAAYYDELSAAAENAPYGKVLAQDETFAVTQGRELLRKSLEQVVQNQAEHEDEKKAARDVLAAELDAIAESRCDEKEPPRRNFP